MLSKPVAIQEILKLMDGNFWIEEKIDGERVQLHMKNGRFEYYSRLDFLTYLFFNHLFLFTYW